MDIEISIIVPVYNLERYLPKCIDSILAQTFTNFELILVNDESTDASGEICEKYASIDHRIKVIHKKNGGVASSRNAGLEVAKGQYIGFVDKDDYINEYMFETLYNNAKTYSSDIVVCDYLNTYEDDPQDIKAFTVDYRIQHYNNIEALNQLYTTNNVTFVVPWNKLYRRCLFENIKYKVGSINDDETVIHDLLYYSDKVTYIQTGLYYYLQRKGSQMDLNIPFDIRRFDLVYAKKMREIFFKKKKEQDLHQKALTDYMESFFWNYYIAKDNLKDMDKELKKLKYTFNTSLISLLRHKEIGRRRKIMFVLFWVNPSLFELVRDFREDKRIKQQSKI